MTLLTRRGALAAAAFGPTAAATLALAGSLPALAQPAPPGREEGGRPPQGSLPEIATATTRHEVEVVGGGRLAYTAEAGTLAVPEPPAAPVGRMFYVAYTLDGAEPGTRPVSFVLNGGPGAASAFLHLGGLGPRRAVFGPDGAVPPPPARLVANAETWLAFTDLVFVDPVGTGYSRVLPGEGEGRAEAFWARGADLRSLGAFIRRFLTTHGRWRSPKLVVGESYGGFRAAALAARLTEEYGVELSGVVLVSPALELSLLEDDNYELLPSVLRLPSYTAAALAHGRLPPEVAGADPLAAAEAFALGELLPGLARGSALDAGARQRLYATYARLSGLPVEVVARHRGRVPPERFAKELLRDRTQVVNLYDASLAQPDPDPSDDTSGRDDLERITAHLSATFADHARAELGVATELPYVVLNREVNRRWNWEGGRSEAGAADGLAGALVTSPGLRALLVHGVHDLVTAYFANDYVVAQMVLDDDARGRIASRRYQGGHMFYTRDDGRRAFLEDARAFYGAIGTARG